MIDMQGAIDGLFRQEDSVEMEPNYLMVKRSIVTRPSLGRVKLSLVIHTS